VIAYEAIDVGTDAYEGAKSFGLWLARQLGFTAEDDHRGLVPAAILAYRFLYPPVRALWTIEKQVSGVLEQLYTWLGGAGSAVSNGVTAIENDIGTAVKDLEFWNWW
jgi:hypothetical protein